MQSNKWKKRLLSTLLGLVAFLSGGTPTANAKGDTYESNDTCEDVVKQYNRLIMPGEGQIMPRFPGIPSDVPEPGAGPNGSLVVLRKTKCWIQIQLSLAWKYPELADAIAINLLKQQQDYYEAEIAKRTIWLPMGVAAGGLLLGLVGGLLLRK